MNQSTPPENRRESNVATENELSYPQTVDRTRSRLALYFHKNIAAKWARGGVAVLSVSGSAMANIACPMETVNITESTGDGTFTPTEVMTVTSLPNPSTNGTTEANSTFDTTGISDTMSGTEDSTDSIDPTEVTTGEPAICPPDYCMPQNTKICEMKGDVTPICSCKEGSDGDRCEICLLKYENQGTPENVNCVLDKTPPKTPEITDPNKGNDLLIITASFFLQASVDGSDTKEPYYRINYPPYDPLNSDGNDNISPDDLMLESLMPFEKYDPAKNAVGRVFDQTPVDKPVQYEVYAKDSNGNLSEKDSIIVTRVNP